MKRRLISVVKKFNKSAIPQDKWSHICDSNLIKKSSSFPAFHHQFLPVMPFTYPWGSLFKNFKQNSLTLK